jgi:hypothetical protein
MVVRMMMGQTSQIDPGKNFYPYKFLSFQVINDAGEEISHFPVAVKNLTTAGVILEILHLDNGLKTDSFKGIEGLLTIVAHDDRIMAEVPGRILWTRNREGDAEITFGLELLEPLPLLVRQTLEANMSIGAKDMKVLWDYWDEIQAEAITAEPSGPERTLPLASDHGATAEEQTDTMSRSNWLYWVGFGAIASGLAMQFPQSEYLGFSGLVTMFFGSLVVAWRSIMSMRQLASSSG